MDAELRSLEAERVEVRNVLEEAAAVAERFQGTDNIRVEMHSKDRGF